MSFQIIIIPFFNFEKVKIKLFISNNEIKNKILKIIRQIQNFNF